MNGYNGWNGWKTWVLSFELTVMLATDESQNLGASLEGVIWAPLDVGTTDRGTTGRG